MSRHSIVTSLLKLWMAWHETPLYLRIICALGLGVLTGLALGEQAQGLALPSQLILRLLGALAPPLILVAVIHALMHATIRGRLAARMVTLLVLNTLVAICLGLLVANLLRPGEHATLTLMSGDKASELPHDPEARAIIQALQREGYALPQKSNGDHASHISQFLDSIPRSLLGPLTDKGNVIGVIFLAVTFGVALRRMKDRAVATVGDLIQASYDTMLILLHWIIDLVPLGVFGIVASILGKEGIEPFKALGAFVLSVLFALLLQAAYYLLRIYYGSWVRPMNLLRGARDALVMAFSTASSTITMPVTYARLRECVGLREESASLGALVGSNFNNDGTALYEAMSALFVSQMMVIQGIGQPLTLTQQFLVVLTSVIASVGAAGIPEAGLVTMTLVFTAIGLPTDYIALLLTVDWFLDRCRTTINVLGDMNVSCLLDGKVPEKRAAFDPAGAGAAVTPVT